MTKVHNVPRKIELNDMKSEQSDQLYIWEVTSISDVRRVTKLSFNVVRAPQNNNIEFYKNEIIFNICDTKNFKLVIELEKLLFALNMRNINKIAIKNTEVIFDLVPIREFKEIYKDIQKQTKIGIEMLIYRAPLKVDSKKSMVNIIEEYHNSPLRGHVGTTKMIYKINVLKNMRKMIKEFVNNCKICRKNKQVKHTKEKLIITNTISTAFEI